MDGLTEWWQQRRRGEYFPGIDLGNGHTLTAEEVLEGHYRRLAAQRRPAVAHAAVQVDNNLPVAIAVLAPDLAPLTHLAEDVSVAMPPVEPTADFRRNLHDALERTHRQHSAQRILGARSAHQAQRSLDWIWLVMALVTVAVTLAAGLLLWQRRQAQQTS